MMQKPKLITPILIYMYGLPGSGKSYVSRQLAELFGMAHVSSDRLRFELFENPKHDKTENMVVAHLMDYMAEEFIKAGQSVIYDISVNRINDRRALRDLARRCKAKELRVWVQVDIDTAWTRSQSRDRRKPDDKYASSIDQATFEKYMKSMQNPTSAENYLVLSGKHLFNSHKNAFLRRFNEMGILSLPTFTPSSKPGLTNLINRPQSQAGRVDFSRRNLTIR